MSHIDTLQVYEDLTAAGVPDGQAKAQVHAMDRSFDSSNFATKSDLNSIKSDLDHSISGLKSHINHNYELIRKDFAGLRWLVLGMGALFAVPIIQNIFDNWFK